MVVAYRTARHPPQVLLFSSNETSHFTLHLHSAQQRWLSIAGEGVSDPVVNEH